MIIQSAERDKLAETLRRAKAFLVIEELSPDVHNFEREKRFIFRRRLIEQIGWAIALVGDPPSPREGK